VIPIDASFPQLSTPMAQSSDGDGIISKEMPNALELITFLPKMIVSSL
jgi:hypothetical protein